MDFVVQPAASLLKQHSESGLTDDRLYLRKIIAASGKNFTSASVGVPGGHGVAIAPLPNW